MLVHRPDPEFVADKLKEIVRENIDVDQHHLEVTGASTVPVSYDSPAPKETKAIEPATATSEQPVVQ